jgi:hypothetical protein
MEQLASSIPTPGIHGGFTSELASDGALPGDCFACLVCRGRLTRTLPSEEPLPGSKGPRRTLEKSGIYKESNTNDAAAISLLSLPAVFFFLLAVTSTRLDIDDPRISDPASLLHSSSPHTTTEPHPVDIKRRARFRAYISIDV